MLVHQSHLPERTNAHTRPHDQVLVDDVPAGALTGRVFAVSRDTGAGTQLLDISGNDRILSPDGQVRNFGSYHLWREEFDGLYTEARVAGTSTSINPANKMRRVARSARAIRAARRVRRL